MSMLDATLFGDGPRGFHLTNVLLHTANTLLLFLWLSGMTGRAGPCAFVALVFGLHPLHVESVAWAAERKDVLSTFFGSLTLLAWTWYVKKPGAAKYVVVAVAAVPLTMALVPTAPKPEEVGQVLYNRGLINSMVGIEAIRTAQAKFGNKPLTGEQVRWGFENLNLTNERIKQLGYEGLAQPIKGEFAAGPCGPAALHDTHWLFL